MTANTGLLLGVYVLYKFLKASALGIALALRIEESIKPVLYYLSKRKDFSSLNLFSLSTGFVHTLVILSARL